MSHLVLWAFDTEKWVRFLKWNSENGMYLSNAPYKIYPLSINHSILSAGIPVLLLKSSNEVNLFFSLFTTTLFK